MARDTEHQVKRRAKAYADLENYQKRMPFNAQEVLWVCDAAGMSDDFRQLGHRALERLRRIANGEEE